MCPKIIAGINPKGPKNNDAIPRMQDAMARLSIRLFMMFHYFQEYLLAIFKNRKFCLLRRIFSEILELCKTGAKRKRGTLGKG